MTAPRAKIEASLAERGRPAIWANEQEAAVLSGMAPERFRAVVGDLEDAGFPQVDSLNGQRFIPAIEQFWARRVDAAAIAVPQYNDERALENFDNGQSQGQRRAS